MTRGQRSNRGGQTKRSTDTKENKIPDEDFSAEKSSFNSNNKNAAPAAGRNRNKDKHKNVLDEEVPKVSDDLHETKTAEVKREHHPKATPQPTSEQLMIAQLIGGDTKADDPNHRQKIQKVIDITGKEEDAVATALFDAGWDENRAIELLLEDGDHLTAWEETGSKKRKNKSKQSADEIGKDDWDESETFQGQDRRENSRGRGPPRMRRGGSQQSTAGPRNTFRDQSSHERDDPIGGSSQSRGGGPRRGDPSARRGGPAGGAGGRGGGGRAFQTRQAKPEQSTGGFSGSIDTWNNPPAPGGNGSVGSITPGVVGSAGAPGSGAPGKRSSRGSGGKDAFENAGNWGDDFPQADDWDNEEYTGSLNETKVFTARTNVSAPSKGQTRPQGPAEPSVPPTQQQQPTPNSTVIGQNRSYSSSNGPSGPTVLPPQPASFSQSIDLSTLLQKPSTQSALSSAPSQQQSMLHYNQQATETLRAGLGIGQPSSMVGNNKPSSDLNSFSYAASSVYSTQANNFVGQGSAFTTIKPSQGQSPSNVSTNGQSSIGSSLPQRSVAPAQPQPSKPTSTGMAPQGQPRPRMPPSSKIPTSAVEMPGDNMTQLDVQFGGMDLVKFVNTSDSGIGGFEYQPSEDPSTKYLQDKTSKPQQSAPGLYQQKDVNKSLTSGLSSSGPVKMEAYPSTNSVSNSLPKSTPSTANQAATQYVNSARNPIGAMDMKSVQQLQQQPETLATYMGYGYGQNKPYHHQSYGVQNQYQQGQYGNSNQYNSSSSAYASQNSYSSTPSSGYKSSGGNQYHQAGDSLSEFDSGVAPSVTSGHQSAVNNPAVLGLTSTTNALSGKVSATTAGKVPNVPNIPPGPLMAHQYMANLPPAAFFGMQQPALYATGMEDYAALQRSGGLHTLANTPSVPQPGGMKVQSTGFYDPNNAYGGNSLPTGNRNDGPGALNSLGNTNAVSTASGTQGSNSNTDKGGFGSSGVATSDSNSSPIPSSGMQTTQQSQQQAAQQAATLGFAPASNAYQQMPPGYATAYFYPGIQYGQAAPTNAPYPGTPMTVPTGGGSASSQFQKPYNYGYETLGQQSNKDFSANYSAGNGAAMSAKSSAGGSAAQGAAGHQYWGTSPLTTGQLW